MTAQRAPYIPLLVPEVPQSVSEAYGLYRGMDLDTLRSVTTIATETMLDIVVVRFGAGLAIDEVKQRMGQPLLDSAREAEVLHEAEQTGERLGLRREFSALVTQTVMDECRYVQEGARE